MSQENKQENIQEENTTSLLDHTWDDESTSWFGITKEVEEPKVTTVKKAIDSEGQELEIEEDNEVEVKAKAKAKTKEVEEEEVEEEVTFFEDEVKETQTQKEKESEGSSTEGKEEDNFFGTLASEMKERGIFRNFEVTEGEEVDEERFYQELENEVEARLEEGFEAFGEELDEDAKAFIQFKRNKGKTSDFFNVYGNALSLEGLDTSIEKDQDAIIRHYCSVVEGMEEDEIADRIEWLKEGNKKKGFADKYLGKLEDMDRVEKEVLLENAETLRKERVKAQEEFNKGLVAELQSIESVGKFKFSKNDKKELTDYVTKATVKVGKNQFITPFQQAMGNIFRAEGENKQKLLLLAKLLKSNFDVKDIITETKTETIRSSKDKLQKARQGVKPASTGGASRKSLADYF